MKVDTKDCLTYVLENGYEKTINIDPQTKFEFVKWFKDANSNNVYELAERVGKRITLFKDTILFVKY